MVRGVNRILRIKLILSKYNLFMSLFGLFLFLFFLMVGRGNILFFVWFLFLALINMFCNVRRVIVNFEVNCVKVIIILMDFLDI